MTSLDWNQVPDWAISFFTLQNDGNITLTLSTIPSQMEEEKAFLEKTKATLKLQYQELSYFNIEPSKIKEYARNYILCNLALGCNSQLRASERKRNGEEKANDGTNRQHWIPECYLDAFAPHGQVRKIAKGTLDKLPLGPLAPESKKKNKDIGIKIDVKNFDFCETKYAHGELYDPWFELVLSKIEEDYGQLEKTSKPVKNLWDFIALTTFFLVFHLRTKEQSQLNSRLWAEKHNFLIEFIPSVISELEVYGYTPPTIFNSLPSFRKKAKLPFNQHPIIMEPEEGLIFSLWCVYTPECFLWFRHKNSKYSIRGDDNQFFLKRLFKTLGNNRDKALYFPVDTDVWTLGSMHDLFKIKIKDGKQ